MPKYVMALDQGTTSSRAIIFDDKGAIISSGQHDFQQIYPFPGWVEHDPYDILFSQIKAMKDAYQKSGISAKDIAAIGITNQRETTIIWDKETGKPVYNAIVWQCRRTADICDDIKKSGIEEYITQKTGLIVDAYFSASKIKWIFENVEGAKSKAKAGKLLFGTVDTWLIWNLTGEHVSDHSNCSRTMLFDIDKKQFDGILLKELGIPQSMLPRPVSSSEYYGSIKPGITGIEELAGIEIRGAAGDQAAALLGQGCINVGDAKNTYGTGCFALMNAGQKSVRSKMGLLTSCAWTLDNKTTYAIEGSVFNAGSSIKWLRDEMGIITNASEVGPLAETVKDNGGVYLVSAFTGLGAPHWDMRARGTIVGITRGTSRAHIARATLEGIAYQVKELISCMEKDAGQQLSILKVDGGASVCDFLMQFQSDILRRDIDRPEMVETTAFGAAFLAGLSAGVWTDISDIAKLRKSQKIFSPEMDEEKARKYVSVWQKAVKRALDWDTEN